MNCCKEYQILQGDLVKVYIAIIIPAESLSRNVFLTCAGKFGRFRKTGKTAPASSTVLPVTGTSTVVTSSTTTAVAPIATETTTAPSYAPNYGGVAAVNEADGNLGKGAWASKGGMAGGNGSTVV